MDELLQKAFERRDQLRAELEAIDRFISSYGVIKDRPQPSVSLFDDEPVSVRRSRSDQAAAIGAMMAAASDLIMDEGRPLSRSELVERLQASGYSLEGGDKSKVLGTNLWRSKRFINVKGEGYWPKGTPLPHRFASLPRRKSSLG